MSLKIKEPPCFTKSWRGTTFESGWEYNTQAEITIKRCVHPERGEEVQFEITIYERKPHSGRIYTHHDSLHMTPEHAETFIEAMQTIHNPEDY